MGTAGNRALGLRQQPSAARAHRYIGTMASRACLVREIQPIDEEDVEKEFHQLDVVFQAECKLVQRHMPAGSTKRSGRWRQHVSAWL